MLKSPNFAILCLSRNDRPRYSHGFASNRSISPPPVSSDRRFGGGATHRDTMYDGYLPPHSESAYRHDYDDLSATLGYKRPAYAEPSSSYYPGGGNPIMGGGYSNPPSSHGPPSSQYYDNMHLSKKPRRDW